MPLPRKTKKGSELGRAIIKRAAADSRTRRSAGLGFAAADTLADAGAGGVPLQSVTELSSLEDFLSHAAMAEQTFTAERGQSTFAAGAGYAAAGSRAAAASLARSSASPAAAPAGAGAGGVPVSGGTVLRWLRIPRRPRWEDAAGPAELHTAETQAFLAWRREVARLESEVQAAAAGSAPSFGGIGLGSAGEAAVTPFEKNLAIWQQLWRVVEKADVLVQIVDARDPTFYYCPDVDAYVAEISPAKRTLVLVNKADYLTAAQREAWAAYFDAAGRDFAFFSARDELDKMEAEDTAQRGGTGALPGRAPTDAALLASAEVEAAAAAAAALAPAALAVGVRAPKSSLFAALAAVDGEGAGEDGGSAEPVAAAAAAAAAGGDDGGDDDDDAAADDDEVVAAASAPPAGTAAPAAAAPAAPPSRSRILTRDELVDFLSARYGELPRQRQHGATPASLARYAELLAQQRAAARAERAAELKRRADLREKMIQAGLGAAVRFGDARDVAALDEADGEEASEAAAAAEAAAAPPPPLMVGMVGYPNVGKSSTINALLGATAAAHSVHRVAVAATPGKTKHYQTLPLSDNITLVDCPGLVFPSFVSTREEMVCNGVLPIDQLRDHLSPMRLVCARIPRATLESLYGIKLPAPAPLDMPLATPAHAAAAAAAAAAVLRQPTPAELLDTFCHARGLMGASHSGPDHARASRILLKDYTEGKLLYAHPPPGDWARWGGAAAAAPAPAPAAAPAPAPTSKPPPRRWDSVLAPGADGGVPAGDLDASPAAGTGDDTLLAFRRVVRLPEEGSGDDDDDGEGDEDEDEEDDDEDEDEEEKEATPAPASAGAAASSPPSLWTRTAPPPSKAKAAPVFSGGAYMRGKPVVPAEVGHAASADATLPRTAAGRHLKKERRLRKGESRPGGDDPYGTASAADAACRAYNLEEQARVAELSRMG